MIPTFSEFYYTKHLNTLSGQNKLFFNVQAGGTYDTHCALKCPSVFTQKKNQTVTMGNIRKENKQSKIKTPGIFEQGAVIL
jgi:hypothetical protein